MDFWGPHGIYEQSCGGPHKVLDLEITTSLSNDLCNVAQSKINLQKIKKVITFLASVKLSLNDKNLYLSNVACDQSFKRLFDNDLLQYCRNSLVISESYCRLRCKALRAASLTPLLLTTAHVLYCCTNKFLISHYCINKFQRNYSLNSFLYCNIVINIDLLYILFLIHSICDFLHFLHRHN